MLDELVPLHGRQEAIRVDNGPDFPAQPFVEWCAAHRIVVHYIQPGKPDQNVYIERFNRNYRGEFLDQRLVEAVGELQALSSSWLHVYNRERPTTASAGCRP